MVKNLSRFKSLICLNGNLPDKKFFLKAIENGAIIVAADGGANKLCEIGITPDFIVGDMDSHFSEYHLSADKIILREDQDSTDFEKSLNFIQQKQCSPVLILGMSGGEIDHIINNVATFVRYSDSIDMWFYDIPNVGKSKIGRVAKNLDVLVGEDATVSLFSFDNGMLKTEGMVWEIDSEPFHLMNKSAARNRAKQDRVKISTTEEKLLTIFDGEF